MRRRVPVVAVLALGLLSGCTFSGLNEVHLPGGPHLGSHPIHITVDLANTASLAEQSAVKVDDVTVGDVESISISGWQPQAQVVLAEGTVLPANAVASVRQTGLLGEKYLELSVPTGVPATGQLADGAVIPASRTTTGVEVEEVLGALSLLLNGGNIDAIRTITVELHRALGGRTGDARALISQLNQFTGTLSANRDAIVGALNGLDRLAGRLAAGHRTIEDAISAIQPAVALLANQRRQLNALLTATTKLATVGNATLQATQADLISNLQSLQPILTRLNEAGDSLPRRLKFLLSFPFPDAIMTAIHGDYVNANLQIDATLAQLQALLASRVPGGHK